MRRTMLSAALCVLACSRPDPRAIAPDPVPDAHAVTSVPAPVVETPKVPTVWCENDTECGWDDVCLPKACVGKSETAVGCEKSAAPPGSCTCIENRCTLLRKVGGAAKTGCKSNDECAFDAATGSCEKGASSQVRSHGAFCRCDSGTCTPEIVEPVHCKSTKDCSWLEHPMRPAPASKVPRPYPPIVPCKTGEHESACVKGVCELQVWKC